MDGWIILVILAALILFVIGIYNSLVRLRVQVRNAWSQIDVQLKRRHDLIPNLVEVVKDYMGYEQETLQKVIQARSQAMNATNIGDKAQKEGMLTGALKSLFALSENYPDLKANQNVAKLQEELTSTENKISFSRQFYNDSVMAFNIKCQTFPANMIANMFNFTREEFFKVAEEERAPVKVDLR
ncbi:LemA protein [hydrothermal vent metagenome]|uniref:LemA protein n=1 Tax=hydrothermal vent metagenome TaxID=652676 RepID=A0A3B1BKD5_9ZZZZ